MHNATAHRKVRATAPAGGAARKGNRYALPTAPTSTATYANMCAIAAPVQQCPGCLAPYASARAGLCTCGPAVQARTTAPGAAQAKVVARHVAAMRQLPPNLVAHYVTSSVPVRLRAAVVQAAAAL